MRRCTRSVLKVTAIACCGAMLSLALVATTHADETAATLDDVARIEVFPPQIKLESARRAMHLVVTGVNAAGQTRDLTDVATFESTNPAIATIDQGIVRPVADGVADIRVTVNGQETLVPVEVLGQAAREPVSFQYGALVALSKQGCNSGACHGSPSGKGGFRLSLRAYDAALDIYTLTQEDHQRRVNLLEPSNSLVLQKPTMAVTHGGGQKLQPSDPAYALLHDWIAEGGRVDTPERPRCVRIEVYPPARTLHYPATTQQIIALAHFSDGSVRDITDVAVYSSSDEAVASADVRGQVQAKDRGEAAILVRYLEHMETSRMTFLRDVEGFAWNDPKENNFVDQHVFDKLRLMQILPSDLCTDDEFIRRAHLDVVGELPTPEETRAFLSDPNPWKRSHLIDALLERPEYSQFWALKWGDLLKLGNKRVSQAGVHKFHHWLVSAVARNMPYDEFARELLTASGSTFANPAANYYRTATDTNECTETTSQVFLGVRIQCAKCHNHPFERWTQDNYYGIGAFFHRVARKSGSVPDELVVFASRSGEIVQPRTGKQMPPWLPLVGDAQVPDDEDRRQAFAEWLTRPENPFFARVAVNRIWGHLMGRGIVEPVDDFRDSNPPANAPLLDALAEDFAAHGFDWKHTLRTILNSRTYQLSSRTNSFNAQDVKYSSHTATRLQTAEQLLDAICQVTGVPEKYPGLPAGIRATQLPSPDVDHPFLKTFGQPARETACQCERGADSNLSQALQLINGPLVHAKLKDEHNRFRTLVAAGKSDRAIVTELYLSAFSRPPSEQELAVADRHIAASGDRLAALEDLCWAVINANEFLFQH
ncbi:MAG: DUF1553 domain-containing protein [Planctomycetia bacterium]|nr:DUF1553 domain-containing protein [Planctomycetia bacterium]